MQELLSIHGQEKERVYEPDNACAGSAIAGLAIVGKAVQERTVQGVSPVVDIENFCIKHKLNGCDKLSFSISTRHDGYSKIAEEAKVEYGDNDWLVKKINDDKVECEIDFDFLKSRVHRSYESKTRTLTEVLEDHLPEGWTVQNGNIVTIRRTIRFDICTDFDVVMECMNTYGVYFVWATKLKTVTVYHPDSMPDTGEYLTDELNLSSVEYKGETTEFITRLYAYGAEGLSIKDAMYEDEEGNTNLYGLEYVENFSYSDKVVCGYWSDERFTDANSLKEAAEEKLSTLAYPIKSYECDVIDLAKQSDKYSFLDIKMHKKLTMIDTSRGIKVKHQVVEYKEYPHEPTKNKVTLACVTGDIMTSVKTTSSKVHVEIEKNNVWVNERVAQVTAMLATALGGHVYSNGSEIFIMDTDDPATALNVWRWNVNGFGHSSTGIDGPYSMAMTYDNQFIADIISATIIRGSRIEAQSIQSEAISQSYTDGVLEQSFSAAEGIVRSAISQIETYLTNDDGTGQLDVIQKTISDVKQSVDGFIARMGVSYTGGINYVNNSAGLNGVSDDWTYTGTVVTLQSSDTKNYTVSNSCFRLSEGATLGQTIGNGVIGKVYTISIKAKKTSKLVDGYFKVVYNGNEEAYLVNNQDTYEWTEFVATLPELTNGEMVLSMYSGGDYLFVSDIMVSEGSTKKEWTPAPNELYTTEVKIDRHGIEVSNSESETRTVINHAEFAVYNNEEKVITVNKDETHLKKAIVEEDLTIGKLKIIPLEDPSEGVNIVLLD